MAHDLIIRNGLIVDGLLNPAYLGDVAIDADTITALGKVCLLYTSPSPRD